MEIELTVEYEGKDIDLVVDYEVFPMLDDCPQEENFSILAVTMFDDENEKEVEVSDKNVFRLIDESCSETILDKCRFEMAQRDCGR